MLITGVNAGGPAAEKGLRPGDVVVEVGQEEVRTPAQIVAFRAPANEIVVGFAHENYAHMAVVPEDVRQALAADFD